LNFNTTLTKITKPLKIRGFCYLHEEKEYSFYFG